MTEETLTRKEVMRLLKIKCPKTIQKMERAGKLRPVPTGGKMKRYSATAVNALINGEANAKDND
ncbi:MAG: helix-turn-helix domain-containing protein [Selenomonadaceae bacterium]|nr:helix-turn-helix domain-containing protein [Selenomonadaceae bacterium]